MRYPDPKPPVQTTEADLVRRRALQIYVAINKGDPKLLAQISKRVRHYLNLSMDSLVALTISRPGANEFAQVVDICINSLAAEQVAAERKAAK